MSSLIDHLAVTLGHKLGRRVTVGRYCVRGTSAWRYSVGIEGLHGAWGGNDLNINEAKGRLAMLIDLISLGLLSPRSRNEESSTDESRVQAVRRGATLQPAGQGSGSELDKLAGPDECGAVRDGTGPVDLATNGAPGVIIQIEAALQEAYCTAWGRALEYAGVEKPWLVVSDWERYRSTIWTDAHGSPEALDGDA